MLNLKQFGQKRAQRKEANKFFKSEAKSSDAKYGTKSKPSKIRGPIAAYLTGEKITAPKNTHFDAPAPKDFQTAEFHRKRGNTFRGQVPNDKVWKKG